MHPCFNVRNFERLRLTFRRVAKAAANGSIEEFQRIMMGIATAPKAPESYLFLPLCWIYLDSSRIPSSAHDLDILMESNAVFELPKGPVLALQIIRWLTKIPQSALVDLCPHVWLWICFLTTYRDVIQSIPQELYLHHEIFSFVDRIPRNVVDDLPELRSFVLKAWKGFIATEDLKTPGFPELLKFLLLRSHCGSIPDAHIAEYAEGAGGTPEDLAAVIYDHLTLVARKQSVYGIMAGLQFALAVEPERVSSLFHASLRNRGIIRLLTTLASELFQSEDRDKRLEGTLARCTSLLALEMSHPGGHLWFPQAIRAGLLPTIAALSALASDRDIGSLRKVVEQLKGATVYHSVLTELERHGLEFAWETPMEVQNFKNSPIFSQWTEFVSLAQDRLELKNLFDSPDYVTHKACDNLECGKIMPKPNFKSCTGCRTMYYCDRSCQRADWVSHRVVCQNLDSLRRNDSLAGRDKSFMRALVQQTYQRNKREIFRLQLANMTRSSESPVGAHVYIWQNFAISLGTPVIGSYTLRERYSDPRTNLEVQQADYEARARRDPRFELYCVTFPGQPPRIFPMRSSDARVREGLIRIAREIRDGVIWEEKKMEGLEGLPISTIH
ncbi:hypothetical protein DFH07DRAFT_939697 [Mycena maculata]|uniref:MYND-type domain-containing protein n=1 Tax=Mycena maculata TaxID=230809 RepID=A0AAD7NGM2_9AGAR|nr:hypothetical protein DFH07DRAFT_939697 [Mycena maculata]